MAVTIRCMDTRKILAELRAERNRIEQAISAIEGLRKVNSARRSSATSSGKPRRRRRLSAAARKRISEMMKQRWAERRKKSKAA